MVFPSSSTPHYSQIPSQPSNFLDKSNGLNEHLWHTLCSGPIVFFFLLSTTHEAD